MQENIQFTRIGSEIIDWDIPDLQPLPGAEEYLAQLKQARAILRAQKTRNKEQLTLEEVMESKAWHKEMEDMLPF